ncbi:hypothetical protein TWF694_010983 [Orbilia ellipsospora]|uniref:Uncharacterized protein n=1 Tax=Orbilia ellipsospora TaxID=2528407 RepID=A0AAV9X8L7_9PEZI
MPRAPHFTRNHRYAPTYVGRLAVHQVQRLYGNHTDIFINPADPYPTEDEIFNETYEPPSADASAIHPTYHHLISEIQQRNRIPRTYDPSTAIRTEFSTDAFWEQTGRGGNGRTSVWQAGARPRNRNIRSLDMEYEWEVLVSNERVLDTGEEDSDIDEDEYITITENEIARWRTQLRRGSNAHPSALDGVDDGQSNNYNNRRFGGAFPRMNANGPESFLDENYNHHRAWFVEAGGTFSQRMRRVEFADEQGTTVPDMGSVESRSNDGDGRARAWRVRGYEDDYVEGFDDDEVEREQEERLPLGWRAALRDRDLEPQDGMGAQIEVVIRNRNANEEVQNTDDNGNGGDEVDDEVVQDENDFNAINTNSGTGSVDVAERSDEDGDEHGIIGGFATNRLNRFNL